MIIGYFDGQLQGELYCLHPKWCQGCWNAGILPAFNCFLTTEVKCSIILPLQLRGAEIYGISGQYDSTLWVAQLDGSYMVLLHSFSHPGVSLTSVVTCVKFVCTLCGHVSLFQVLPIPPTAQECVGWQVN